MADELSEIAGPNTRVVTVRGRIVTVREVDMTTLTPFVAACSPFLSAFDEAGALADRVDPTTGDKRPPDEFALFKVLAENGPAFVKAAALVSDADVKFLGALRPDEFFTVASAVVEVNGSFFVLRLAPALIKFARDVSQVGTILSNS